MPQRCSTRFSLSSASFANCSCSCSAVLPSSCCSASRSALRSHVSAASCCSLFFRTASSVTCSSVVPRTSSPSRRFCACSCVFRMASAVSCFHLVKAASLPGCARREAALRNLRSIRAVSAHVLCHAVHPRARSCFMMRRATILRTSSMRFSLSFAASSARRCVDSAASPSSWTILSSKTPLAASEALSRLSQSA